MLRNDIRAVSLGGKMQANQEMFPCSGIKERTYAGVPIKDGAWMLEIVSGM